MVTAVPAFAISETCVGCLSFQGGTALDRLMILAIAIVIAGALSGGLYTTTGDNSAYVVNRFTGHVWFCGFECKALKYSD